MTRRGAKRARKAEQLPTVALVFAEDANDADSLRALVQAISPKAPRIDFCRKPPILIRDARRAEDRKKNAANVGSVVRAKRCRNHVLFVIAHQDCDAVEPAHKNLRDQIRSNLQKEGVPNPIAVTPAWELEAWWYLWPEAVARVNSKWRRLSRQGNHGLIVNAKEQLRRDLRARGTRDYEESDSPRIASHVRDLKLADKLRGQSRSFALFRSDVLDVLEPDT